MDNFWCILLIFALTVAIIKHYGAPNKRAPLPPGPPADPIIGHMRSIPTKDQNMYFHKLGQKYGDVVHLNILGQSLIVLNSIQAVVDLLDKRSSIYSGRPSLPVFDILGVSDGLPFLDYGQEFRTQRKMVQGYFTKNQRKDHQPIQLREARIMAQNFNLAATPEDRWNVFLRFSAAIILEISYGQRIESNEDPLIAIADDFSHVVVGSGSPGSTLLDLFPILRRFPSWFPGTYYANFARKNVDKFIRVRDYPFNRAKEQIANGTAKPSFVSSQLEQLHSRDTGSMKQLQAAAVILYIAGTESTASTISFFCLAMALFPECQARAQQELDSVVGLGRLPDFGDRDNLPYLECLIQEVFRWNQAAPTGGPRKLLEDDTYKGMWIPKGSTIIPNVRGMTLDENVYKDPFKFNPSRFLPAPAGRGEPYPTVFGWGRRICPGRYLAEDSVWIATATLLATMSISKAIGGEDGKEITSEDIPIITGINSHPKPYPCQIKPRSDLALGLLQEAVEEGESSL